MTDVVSELATAFEVSPWPKGLASCGSCYFLQTQTVPYAMC